MLVDLVEIFVIPQGDDFLQIAIRGLAGRHGRTRHIFHESLEKLFISRSQDLRLKGFLRGQGVQTLDGRSRFRETQFLP